MPQIKLSPAGYGNVNSSRTMVPGPWADAMTELQLGMLVPTPFTLFHIAHCPEVPEQLGTHLRAVDSGDAESSAG